MSKYKEIYDIIERRGHKYLYYTTSKSLVMNIIGREFNVVRYGFIDYYSKPDVSDFFTSKKIIEDITEVEEFRTSPVAFETLRTNYISSLNNEHLESLKNVFYFVTGEDNMFWF